MCTCISYYSKSHYFGRNLDLEYSLNESVIITPQNYKLPAVSSTGFSLQHAMIGIGIVQNSYPLYYDAMNEHGLCMAGLNFPGNAVYLPPDDNKINIPSFALIPWVLGQYRTVAEVKRIANTINLTQESFSEKYPPTPLHWMLSDSTETVVIEQTETGLQIYENPFGVLTNNPPFHYHRDHLADYLNLSNQQPDSKLWDKTSLIPYSRGMGAIGLPGDMSSASRFVRCAFMKLNSVDDGSEYSAVSQFFHILDSVKQIRGAVAVNDSYEITVYSSCYNTDKGILYYKTYENSQLTAITLDNQRQNSSDLTVYPLITKQQINRVLN